MVNDHRTDLRWMSCEEPLVILRIIVKDRLLWFEADLVKQLYIRHCWDFGILYTK